MDKVARLSSNNRNELFTETAARRNMTPAIVEKDFWVTWIPVPGTFKLVPQDSVMKAVRDDYRAMRNMIFGTYPDIDTVMNVLLVLEKEINKTAIRPNRRSQVEQPAF